ncbi:MAG: hypothetical protein ACK4Q4_06435 [Rhodocyclaceae bacterium]
MKRHLDELLERLRALQEEIDAEWAAHERYPRFLDYGDAESFRQGLRRLRRQYEKD